MSRPISQALDADDADLKRRKMQGQEITADDLPPELRVQPDGAVPEPTRDEIAPLRAQKDGAYRERDACVALIAKLAASMGWRVGMARHEGEWEDDWRWIVYIDLPTGQVSWHIHDSEREWFDFPEYPAKWDGHSMYEKYDRMAAARLPEPGRTAE